MPDKKQAAEQLMIAAVGMTAICLYQVNAKLTGHLETCTQASKNLRNIAIGVLVIVIAQLLMGFFHLKGG